MKRIGTLVSLVLLASCNGGTPPPPSDPNDTTPPAVTVTIMRYGHPDIVAGAGPGAPVGENFGPLTNASGQPIKIDFTGIATADDPESGITDVKFFMTRNVCYRSSGGAMASALQATIPVKTAAAADPQHAPRSLSVAYSGVIDAANPGTTDNLLVVNSSQGTRIVGVGVKLSFNMQARNFVGQTVYSKAIRIAAGDTGCPD